MIDCGGDYDLVSCELNACDKKCEVLWLRMGKDDSWECNNCEIGKAEPGG